MAKLKDIAEAAGVNMSTVSLVLNRKTTKIKVSERTRRRIFETAERLKYEPNASARALATGRSGNLGFVLSDQITGGWGNAFFAAQLTGVEDRCRELGYGLSISRYNLTNLDKFVFPLKVRQRNVDGLVIAGDFGVPVIRRFQEFGVPCVAIGASSEVAGLVPSVNVDIVSMLAAAITYAYESGHRRIAIGAAPSIRSREVVDEAVARLCGRMDGLDVHVFPLKRQLDWLGGEELFGMWAALPAAQRPTLVIGSDQSSLGFLKAMKEKGYRCPQDVSLIGQEDTELCRYADPPITAISTDNVVRGRRAVDLLADHLDRHAPLGPEQSIIESQFKLIERKSCRSI